MPAPAGAVPKLTIAALLPGLLAAWSVSRREIESHPLRTPVPIGPPRAAEMQI